jgi:hypothetical protein
MGAIFPIVVQLVLGVLTQGPQALRELIAIGEQTGALTPEQAADFYRQMQANLAARRWQTDEQLAAQGGAGSPLAGGAFDAQGDPRAIGGTGSASSSAPHPDTTLPGEPESGEPR